MQKFALILGFILSLSASAWAENFLPEKWYDKLAHCTAMGERVEQRCQEKWSIKCYNYRMQTQKNIQQCYKEIAVDLFENFYGLSEIKAKEQFDVYNKFIYNQYLFVFLEMKYCQQNNCGVSPYLYSEYATTQEMHNYVNKIIGAISARD